MTLEDVINKFMEIKESKPSNVDEILDFIQTRYVHNELSIVNYRSLYKELHAKGAKKPEYYSSELIC